MLTKNCFSGQIPAELQNLSPLLLPRLTLLYFYKTWGKEVLVPLPHFQQICWCGSFCLEYSFLHPRAQKERMASSTPRLAFTINPSYYLWRLKPQNVDGFNFKKIVIFMR